MEPIDDPQLRNLLREWKVEDAPASLGRRVLPSRKPWWSFLMTGSLRIPVPVGLAIAALLLVMGAALFRDRRPPVPAATGSTFNLVDFRPAQDLNVRIVARHYEAQ